MFRGRRQVGCRVTITDRRIVFMPSRLDALTGVGRQDVELRDIDYVRRDTAGSLASKQRGLSAAIRDQLVVRTRTGTELAFTVNGIDAAISTLIGAKVQVVT